MYEIKKKSNINQTEINQKPNRNHIQQIEIKQKSINQIEMHEITQKSNRHHIEIYESNTNHAEIYIYIYLKKIAYKSGINQI